MLKQCKKMLGVLLLAGFLFPATATLAAAQAGIAPHYMGHYRHAAKVLKAQYPDFLSAFQALQDEIKTVDSSNKQAQYDALMHFFPFIEDMAFMDSYKADKTDENGVLWDLQKEVVVSFFVMDLSTADKTDYISVDKLLREAFMDYSAGGDSATILSEETLIQKHNMSRQDAQRVRSVLHRLYGYLLD